MKQSYRSFGVALAATCLVAATGCPAKNGDPRPGETRIFDGIEFQWCPPGTFIMGSPADEEGHEANETQREVTISEGFWLGKYEITQAQWAAVMGTNPSNFEGSIRPVEKVSWDDVQYFLAELNGAKSAIGGPYRLPTDAEWEYACRAGSDTRFYWGEDSTETEADAYAWHEGNATSKTHNVGEKLPNEWGLYDMSGNVFEICQDWLSTYSDDPVTDPQGPASGTYRVIRGGSWFFEPRFSRSAGRYATIPDDNSSDAGFRLLRMQD